MIQPTESFKDNLALLPGIEGIARIDLTDADGADIARIENAAGKQGSLAVYAYLAQHFDRLDSSAARHATAVFAEHTADARNRPGAHPNIDRLFAIIDGAAPLQITVVRS
jgi:hypothetical protein